MAVNNMSLGRNVHSEYYAGQTGKEYVLPSGRRIDYLDIDNGIVYELKPNNPSAISSGKTQAQGYVDELIELGKTNPKFNKDWTYIIDTY